MNQDNTASLEEQINQLKLQQQAMQLQLQSHKFLITALLEQTSHSDPIADRYTADAWKCSKAFLLKEPTFGLFLPIAPKGHTKCTCST